MSRIGKLALAALVAGGCGRPELLEIHDLAALAPVADRSAAWELVRFGCPSAIPLQGRGFVQVVGQPPGEVFSWVEPKVRVDLTWDEVRPRMALLQMAPHPDLRNQSATVSLNGEALGAIQLQPQKRWYRLDLLATHQRAGRNRLELRFSNGTALIKPHRRRLAAAFHALAVGEPDEPALLDLLAEGAPNAIGATGGGDSRGLVQVGPSSLEFALRLPARAELRFTPALHDLVRSAGAAITFRVTLQTRAEADAQEIWRGVLRGTPRAEEVRLPLLEGDGRLVRLGLHVEAAAGRRFAWGIWREPRILGEPQAEPDSRAAHSRADDLRSAVSDANVLLVILDAARAGHLGSYGYHRRTTPEIDRLASEGVVFDRAFTTNVFTLLAMSSLWTSLHPDRHHNGIPYNSKLPKQHLTLAELLSANGDHTAGFVSNAFAGKAFALDRGFGEFHEIYREHGDRADAYAKVLPAWLRENRSRRFFLYVHMREPHFPYNPLEPFDTLFGPEGPLTLYQRGRLEFFQDVNANRRAFSRAQREHLVQLYDGNLAFADRELGRLRATMEDLGLWERTVVIVTADHGEALYEHGHIGHILQLYEESVWIPLIVRFPGGLGPAGTRVSGLVSIVDLAPTVADIFGLAGKGGSGDQFQGNSLLPMVFGAPGRSEVFLRSSYEKPRWAVRDEGLKYIYASSDGLEELYDLREDPGETRNLIERQPLRAAFYRQLLFGWILEQRRGGGGSAERAELTPNQLENLRALGYVR